MLRAGAASRDITPGLGGDFFGYVRPDIRARGVALRLNAHALVLDDGRRRVALLTLDLGAPLVTGEILARVADLGYGLDNLLVAATHTHAGPNKPGAWIAMRAAEAVRAAHEALRPATAAWAATRLDDANLNRSLEAHLANHGMDLYPGTGEVALDPDGDEHPRDTTLRLLRVDGEGGEPLAAWAHFSVHPTTFSPANVYLSSDFPGAATRHFRRGFERPPVAIFTNGTEGDLIPRYDEYNQHACADRMGLRTAAAMRVAWDAAGASLAAELPVDGAVRRVVYEGQEVEPGKRVARKAWFGLPFVGGAANGPHFLYGHVEGLRRPRALAGRVHGRKLVVMPAPWPSAMDVTVLRVGDRLLLGVPGEPSVEAGRRMCAAALDAGGAVAADALIVGLTQGYRGYFTTPEEYDQQHYEGGHTVFGKHTSLLVQHAHAALAAELAATPPLLATVSSSAIGVVQPFTMAPSPPDVPAPVGVAPAAARIVSQPQSTVERFATVSWSWRGSPLGADRPVDAAFLSIERLGHSGEATAVEDDLGTGFVWEQRDATLTARYEVPGDLPPGRYRFRVGEVMTDEFTVIPSRGLRLLGVTADGDRLLFRAQNPPPDPHASLRARERFPVGGRLRFVVDGEEHFADWDEVRGAWVAAVQTMPTAVQVPAHGLVDGSGNTCGQAVTLQVGQVAKLAWPPAMGPGGGRVPGPFLRGPGGKPERFATHRH
jgi:neutral ceramidase